MHLQFALNYLARANVLAGELAAAARLIEEDRLIAEVTGNPPVAGTAMMLAAWRGQEREAAELIGVTRGRGHPRPAPAGRPRGLRQRGAQQRPRAARRRAGTRPGGPSSTDQLGYGPLGVPELAEAASRAGDTAALRAAEDWLAERAQATPTDWALGMLARVRGLLGEGDAAEKCYRESIEQLGRTQLRAHLARGHLLYGEPAQL